MIYHVFILFLNMNGTFFINTAHCKNIEEKGPLGNVLFQFGVFSVCLFYLFLFRNELKSYCLDVSEVCRVEEWVLLIS